YKVTMQKFDPYINIDPGTMNPVQHGEVFVTDDGAETDLDLGHYERFIDESLTKNSNVTTGKVYWSVLQKERRGDFGGGTVQVIPHITNEIKSRFHRNFSTTETEIAIIEVGGTVGDIESQPFLEAIRQFQHEVGHENAILIHVTLIPYLKASGELKTKPTQASVKDLQAMGIWPDILVCRSEHPLDDGLRSKIALFCNVPKTHVLQNLDVEVLYEAPLAMEEEHLAEVACQCLNLPCPEPDLTEWRAMIDAWKHPEKEVTVALVGKYIQLHDAYISVVESLKHGGVANRASVNIKWIDSETVTAENVNELLGDVSGILVPGGFGSRGIEGKILAIKYAREHQVPFLGLCLGMQLSIVEFARDVIGYTDAHSAELDPSTVHPVIHLMPDQDGIEDIGGTLRLGSYPCVLNKESKAYALYGTETIHERHRHRYEVNNDYRNVLQEHGMMLSGISPDGRIVEMIELPDHPWFVATQAHPELKSRPNRPHPLFRGFIEASLKYQKSQN
ncbi:MAG TPA: CTP synthase, partial [Lachnoclostridium sp.]|nr:CTP synthase [Lachnoclostridium sp.]